MANVALVDQLSDRAVENDVHDEYTRHSFCPALTQCAFELSDGRFIVNCSSHERWRDSWSIDGPLEGSTFDSKYNAVMHHCSCDGLLRNIDEYVDILNEPVSGKLLLSACGCSTYRIPIEIQVRCLMSARILVPQRLTFVCHERFDARSHPFEPLDLVPLLLGAARATLRESHAKGRYPLPSYILEWLRKCLTWTVEEVFAFEFSPLLFEYQLSAYWEPEKEFCGRFRYSKCRWELPLKGSACEIFRGDEYVETCSDYCNRLFREERESGSAERLAIRTREEEKWQKSFGQDVKRKEPLTICNTCWRARILPQHFSKSRCLTVQQIGTACLNIYAIIMK
eukprot:TRINITY_DN76948_c0_g1_i1.p1 TRINITY_DN76948_c0_g1~~TRINITY_DN76948_c0_g1_i1.p1  ORF type:complete len:339 (-),score=11.49 TRINITY_DN76948_c0_g1_i1:148-1164(-)